VIVYGNRKFNGRVFGRFSREQDIHWRQEKTSVLSTTPIVQIPRKKDWVAIVYVWDRILEKDIPHKDRNQRSNRKSK